MIEVILSVGLAFLATAIAIYEDETIRSNYIR